MLPKFNKGLNYATCPPLGLITLVLERTRTFVTEAILSSFILESEAEQVLFQTSFIQFQGAYWVLTQVSYLKKEGKSMSNVQSPKHKKERRTADHSEPL